MNGFVAVGLGAALGAWLRWGMGVLFNPVLPSLPLGTLLANLVGGYLIGVALSLFLQYPGLSPEWRLFVVTGFLGGLTTFSTFSAEVVTMIMRQQLGWAMATAACHLVGSLVMTGLGMLTVRYFKVNFG